MLDLIFSYITLFFQNTSVQNILQTLFVAFLGTFAGAYVVYRMQISKDQARFFQELSLEVKKIVSSRTAWQRSVDGKWNRYEYRRALGFSAWLNEPLEIDSIIHEKPRETGISWQGTLYHIDSDFCIASKSLQEYCTWFLRVIDCYENKLLLAKHIRILWRDLIDSLFEIEYGGGKTRGTRCWTERMLFGPPTGNERFEKKKRKAFSQVVDILMKYKPAGSYLKQRVEDLSAQNKLSQTALDPGATGGTL